MNKKLLLSISSILLISLLILGVAPVAAETDDGALSLSFADLGLDEFTVLEGPYQTHSFQFQLPADWQLDDGAMLNLDVSAFFSLYLSIQGNEEVGKIFAGVLSVYLNDTMVESFVIEEDGDRSFEIALPIEILNASNGFVNLSFEWDSTQSCGDNISTYMLLNSTSNISLPYSMQSISPSLANLPQPFYTPLSLYQRGTAIVIPANPATEEISAAMAVAAGLTRASNGKLEAIVFSADQVNAANLSDYNLIFVGDFFNYSNLISSSILSEFNTKTSAQAISETDGVIASFQSPFNSGRILVAISGATPVAVQKAGQAFGSGSLLLHPDQSFSLVTDYLTGSTPDDSPDVFTLSDLGQNDLVFSKFGITEQEIVFDFPYGSSTSSGSYFDIYFNHSRLLDYLQSNMWVEINDVYISSLQFNDSNSDLSLARFVIPPTAVVGGRNVLTIGANLGARSVCADPREGDIWMQVFADSGFTMPRMDQSVAIRSAAQTSFPEMFLTTDDLNDTLFVVSDNNFQALQAAIKLSSFIGGRTSGNNSFPSAIMLSDASQENLANKNIVLIADLDDLGSDTPEILWSILPTNSSGELLSLVGGRTVYQLDETKDYGLLTLAALENDKVGLGIVSKGDDVISWTSNVLFNSNVLDNLSTDKFVIVQGPNAVLMDVESVSADALVDGTLPESETAEVVVDTGIDEAAEFIELQNSLIVVALTILGAILIVLLYFGYKDIVKNRWL